jgi:hypothetical protein
VVGRQGLPPGSIKMELIQTLHPESADGVESPSPMDLSVTGSQAHSLPAASEEADLRVREQEAAVDDLHRQSGIAEDVHRRAIRRVRHRGADPGGLDAHELDARERDAEGKATVIAELLGTRSDELQEAEARAAQLRQPEPDTSRRRPSPSDAVSGDAGTADVPPRPPPGPAADVSPSTAEP